MQLHLATLQFTAGLVVTGALLALLALWRSEHEPRGSGFWLLGTSLYVPGFILLSFRGTLDPLLSVFLSNLALIMGVLFTFRGLRLFVGRTPLYRFEWSLALGFMFIHGFFTFAIPHPGVRVIFISIVISTLCAMIVYTLLREKEEAWRSAGIGVASIFALLGLALLVRIPIVISRFSDYSYQTSVDSAPFFLLLIFFVISITLSLILLSFASLQAEYRMFTSAVFQCSSSIMITDSKGNVQYVNPAYRKRTGFSMLEIMDQDKRKRFGDMQTEDYEKVWQTLRAGKTWRGEVKNRSKEGAVFWEMVSISPVRTKGRTITHIVVIREDISRLKETEGKILDMVNHDALTGLASLRLGKDRLENAMARAKRNKCMTAVLFIDLDGFKAVNDSYGHDCGDRLLQEVGLRLKASVREVDTVARIGGDEFMIVLVDLEGDIATERVSQKIIDELSQPIKINDSTSVTVSASIGVAFYPTNGDNADEVLKQADAAMYQVKRNGKNRFQYAA